MTQPFILRRILLLFFVVIVTGIAAGCASAPPAAPASAPKVAIEKKMAQVLQLEDQRILRVDTAAPAPLPPAATPSRGRARAATPPPPATQPDLTVLLADSEARVRRRAAL